MAGRGRGAARGRGRGRGAAAAASATVAHNNHNAAAKKDSGFAVSLRRAADKAAAAAVQDAVSSSSSASPRAHRAEEVEASDVTVVYRRSSRRPVAAPAKTKQSAPPERHVHFGQTSIHTFDNEEEEEAVRRAPTQTEASPLVFWRRCASSHHVAQALRECAFHITETNAPTSEENRSPTLDELDEERLRVALQALLDARALLHFPRPISGTDEEAAMRTLAQQSDCWVEEGHADAVVALVALSNAALPSREPCLVSQDALTMLERAPLVASWPDRGRSAPLRVVPSPVSPAAVELRLAQLVRVCQLRVRGSVLLPPVRACQNESALMDRLFCHSPHALQQVQALAQSELRAGLLASSVSAVCARAATLMQADACLPLPGLTSRHRREQAVLTGLLKRVNGRDCALDVSSWGPMSMLSPLKLTDGVYVLHHISRVYALDAVLAEAEFYGLPTFLRSIRRTSSVHSRESLHYGTSPWSSTPLSAAGHKRSCLEAWLPTVLAPHDASHGHSGAGGRGGIHTGPSAWRRPAHQLFLCSDVLDGDRFVAPDPMQAAVVQEELIGLCVKHCCYGMVVGEADQILDLLQKTTAYHAETWRRRLDRAQSDVIRHSLKAEAAGDEDTGVTVVHSTQSQPTAVLRDPLGLYARRARAKAREAARAANSEDSADTTHIGGSNTSDTSAAAKEGEPRCTCVDWLCTNRWSFEADVAYYGLIYGVVVEENNGLYSQADEAAASTTTTASGAVPVEEAVDPHAPLDVDMSDEHALKPVEGVTYYVAAAVELHR